MSPVAPKRTSASARGFHGSSDEPMYLGGEVAVFWMDIFAAAAKLRNLARFGHLMQKLLDIILASAQCRSHIGW